MPQMFPMNWLLLPLLFTYTITMIFLKSYMMLLQPIPHYQSNALMTKQNWMW